MSEKQRFDGIKWRVATEEDLEKLQSVKSHSLAASIFFVGAIVFLAICAGIIIKGQLDHSMKNWPIALITFLIAAGFAFFLIRRIHFSQKFECADVVVIEIVKTQSSESGLSFTATVAQDDVVVKNVNINRKTHPEIGEQVLLYIENKDTWSAGIV